MALELSSLLGAQIALKNTKNWLLQLKQGPGQVQDKTGSKLVKIHFKWFETLGLG